MLIDGGLGQLTAARDALNAVTRERAVGEPPKTLPLLAALAKKEEIIYTLNETGGIRLSRHSPGLRLLQHIRDEAHRFAQSYHHILRRKRVMEL